MRRKADIVLVLLLTLAFAQAVVLATRTNPAVRAYLPLMGPQDPPGALQGPGAAEAALRAGIATVGPAVTVEDLARGALALERGELTGAAPLTEAERERVLAIVQRADRHRDELLAAEARLASAEAALADRARAIAATLTPEQRAWIVAQRDAVSVGQVERAYWDELLIALEPDR